jgi:hypothetical protein
MSDGALNWIPRTEAELREAVERGVIDEGDHHDFKGLFQAGEKANRALAVDLASFAVNGGLLIVGVEDGTKSQTPVPLLGLAERVDQVARSRIDPPLSVATFPIPAEGREREGYLVVAVPASPAAPHAVEHVYRGRADRTNVQLSAADVRRIWEERRAARVAAESLLPDTYLPDDRLRAVLRVAMKPEYGDPDALLRRIRSDPPGALRALVDRPPRLTREWYPDLGSHMTFEPRPGGWGLYSGRLNGRDPNDYALDLFIGTTGPSC